MEVHIKENGETIEKMEKDCIFMAIMMERMMDNGETIRDMERV